jgi:transposase
MPRKSPFILSLNAAQRRELEARSRRYTLPYREVVRAKIVLMAAEGLDNDQIAARLDTRREIVSKWRKRFFEDGLAGLEERPRGGRPPVFSP